MSTTEELFRAIDDGDISTIDQLLTEEPKLAGETRDGIGPLRAACYAGHPELAQRLERLGAELDIFDAAALGEVERIRALLEQDPTGATVVAADGFTALHLAAWFGHPKAAELLLARGANPSGVAANDTGLQPIHSAAAGGHAMIAHLLMDRGADVDARQAGGVTPLHSAAHRNDVAMVALLLGRGADPTARTDDGRLAAVLATDAAVLALLP